MTFHTKVRYWGEKYGMGYFTQLRYLRILTMDANFEITFYRENPIEMVCSQLSGKGAALSSSMVTSFTLAIVGRSCCYSVLINLQLHVYYLKNKHEIDF